MEQNWFRSYLTNRVQCCEINGHKSSFKEVKMGVPQGSVAGPLLFLIFINDLCNATDLGTILFADDTTFQSSGSDLHELYAKVNYNLKKAESWFCANGLTLHPKKTKYILFTNHKEYRLENIYLCNDSVERIGENCPTKYFKFLGLLVDDKLNWHHHINLLRGKLSSVNFAL